MSGIQCKSCDKLIDNEGHVPRILVCCGTTICKKCLTRMLGFQKKCPKCGKFNKWESIHDYPVNKALLENIELTIKVCREDLLRKHNQLFRHLAKNFWTAKRPVEILLNCVEVAIKDVEIAEDLLEAFMGTSLNFETMFTLKLLEFYDRYKYVRLQLPSPGVIVRDVALHSLSSSSCVSFLEEVKLALTDGTNTGAAMYVKGVKSRARLSLRNQLLCVHAFEKYVKRDDALTICFRDLQSTLLRSGITNTVYGFLEVEYKRRAPTKTVFIKISERNSYLGSQFLKLCSGELGFSYKGLPYVHEENVGFKYFIKVCYFGWNMFELNSYDKYFVDKAHFSVKCKLDTRYLRFENDGSFDIFECKDQTLTCDRIIGHLNDFEGDMESIFGDTIDGKIMDCGIAYEF